MSNRVKIILASATLGLAVAAAFNIVLATTGSLVVAVPVALVAVLAARSVYRWFLLQQTNDEQVVATAHGPDGRLTAIEVFWRPG